MTKAAQRRIGHGPAGVLQAVPVAGQSSAVRHPLHDFILALGTHLTGVALAAGFIGKKVRQPQADITQVAGFVENCDHTRAKRQAGNPQIFEGQADVELALDSKERLRRRTARP